MDLYAKHSGQALYLSFGDSVAEGQQVAWVLFSWELEECMIGSGAATERKRH